MIIAYIQHTNKKKQKKTNIQETNKKTNQKNTQTTINKHTNKKKPQNTNKINFCSYNLISYRYIDIDTVFHHKQQIFL